MPSRRIFRSHLALTGALLAAGCGTESRPDVDSLSAAGRPGGDGTDAAPGTGGIQSGGSGGAGAGGVRSTGGAGAFGDVGELAPEDVCVGIDYVGEALPVDMYIMLDKSSSMTEVLPGGSDSKWDGAVAAIQAFVSSAASAGLGVGIQYFGQPDACDVGAYATPAVPVERIPEVTSAVIASTNSEAPATLRPTAPALEGALQYMQSRPEARPDRASVVVLATDGLPTRCGASCSSDADCLDSGATCVAGMCEPDSLLTLAAVAEQHAAAEPRIRTFVIGLGEALANLDTIAHAGGTDRALRIEGGDVEEAFLDALLSVVASPLPCAFDFPDEASDPNLAIDRERVDVLFVPQESDAESIPRVVDEAACATNGGEGWWYDDNDDPTRIRVCPDTCERLVNGRISIRIGCMPAMPAN